MKRHVLFVISLAGFLSLPVLAREWTYVDLIGQLYDLRELALLPEPGQTCSQWSSYDRASVYDSSKGYVKWEANGDGDGFIRKEGTSLVLAEMEGPGVIWRTWSAMPKEGHIKFYLDGQETPAIDLPFIGLFDHKHPPFNRPALVHMAARGQNCYVPIPYQKSCKIVAEEGWGRYFQFTYTTYPKGTKIPTFDMELSEEENVALDKANEILSRGGFLVREITPDIMKAERTVTIQPGDRFIAEIEGPRAVAGFGVKMEFEDRQDQIQALREIVLQVFWDNEGKPAIWTPLGDFFGTAPGVNPYKSFPLGMTEEGFYCNWYMPFSTWTRWEFINEGPKPRTLELTSIIEPLPEPAEQWGRFHAKWHRDAFLPKDKARWPDWTILKTDGRGRFCGVNLHIWNPRGGQCPEVAWCHGHYWWGEGDEKFFVNGEKFPSTFGTGTEDYFGYAWGSAELFENCFHNQTISMNNKGHISVNRFQIADNIPFQTSFEGAIEKYYPNHWPTLYDAIVWWYQAPGQSDPYEPAPLEERLDYWPEIPVFRVKGAIEGENMKILGKSNPSSNTTTQGMGGYGPGWSCESQLWWTGGKPGDTLDLALPVEAEGAYELKMQLTKAVDYAIVQFYLDGKKIGGPIDCFEGAVVHTPEMALGSFPLDKGEHKLTFQILGCNEKAVKGYMFGLDYVKLVKVE
ncbi:MAG: DUF2961 domain-containing protein [Sedimentisphaerales bacterium]|nr:DUF2961 domain-containing protein [Sedimentisphaerales bacterium]